MKIGARGTAGFLALLGTQLLVWDVKTVVWLKMGDPDFPLDILYNAKPVAPDAQLLQPTASNDSFAGYALGHSLGAGLDDARVGIVDWISVQESAADQLKSRVRRGVDPTAKLFVSSDTVVTNLRAEDAAAFVRPPSR